MKGSLEDKRAMGNYLAIDVGVRAREGSFLDPTVESRWTSERLYLTLSPQLPPSVHQPFSSLQAVLDNSTVILGVRRDPFSAISGYFDQALLVLEAIGASQARRIHVQTRSALVLLAAPFFKALSQRLAVTVAFETLDDISCQEITPHLPRVSERLEVIRSLHSIGVQVILQLSPLLSRHTTANTVRKWLRKNERYCSEIHLLSARHLIDQHSVQFNRLDRALPGSFQLVVAELADIAPAKKRFAYPTCLVRNPHSVAA